MFPNDEQIQNQFFDTPTAYYCGLIQGAGIGVIGAMVFGGIAVFFMYLV